MVSARAGRQSFLTQKETEGLERSCTIDWSPRNRLVQTSRPPLQAEAAFASHSSHYSGGGERLWISAKRQAFPDES